MQDEAAEKWTLVIDGCKFEVAATKIRKAFQWCKSSGRKDAVDVEFMDKLRFGRADRIAPITGLPLGKAKPISNFLIGFVASLVEVIGSAAWFIQELSIFNF